VQACTAAALAEGTERMRSFHVSNDDEHMHCEVSVYLATRVTTFTLEQAGTAPPSGRRVRHE
jgi:hypothetical protein